MLKIEVHTNDDLFKHYRYEKIHAKLIEKFVSGKRINLECTLSVYMNYMYLLCPCESIIYDRDAKLYCKTCNLKFRYRGMSRFSSTYNLC